MALNTVALVGRLTKEPELKKTSNDVAYVNFTLAIKARGKEESNFINCIAWRNSADYLSKYLHVGDKVSLIGSLQSRSYENQSGTKVYVTEVVVDSLSSE